MLEREQVTDTQERDRRVTPIIQRIVQQHLDEVAMLYTTRAAIVEGPAVRLHDLRFLDDRIAAHCDGVSIAGDEGRQQCESTFDVGLKGSVFTAAVCSIGAGKLSGPGFDRLLTRFADGAQGREEFVSALGWLERPQLQGIVARLLDSDDPSRSTLGIAACAVHRVDPGQRLVSWVRDRSPVVRALALHTAGELGRRDLASLCLTACADEDHECRLCAAWAAVLLGNRNAAIGVLVGAALASGSRLRPMLWLALQALAPVDAHPQLQQLTADPLQSRRLIWGCGLVGDPAYASWLIKQMADEGLSRLAGEAFSLITGVDLAAVALDRPRPEDFESGPTDDPDDLNVEMDPDEGLPWPDVPKVEQWWAKNAGRFQKGQRYFMGAPVTRAHCIDVLKHGYQRQRILAAHYLCLLEPGTPLFNTSAPAWRQQRLLAQMT